MSAEDLGLATCKAHSACMWQALCLDLSRAHKEPKTGPRTPLREVQKFM